uniref:Uncharacterized protein n=1 Tax=Caulobacter sp. (strain K31) TaxID=366602 RepID=B0T0R7_CAUSK
MRSLASKGYAPRMKASELEQTIVGMRQDLAIRRDERSKAQAAVAGVDQQIAKAPGVWKGANSRARCSTP